MYQQKIEDVDEEYKKFVGKFKPQKTTDDCYTPENIYSAILDWVANEYGIDKEKVVRPFWPGGDYRRETYREGCIVVDNPPFSILSEICRYYQQQGIKYFLFAPSLTCLSSKIPHCAIITGAGITYENGADVATAFVTNLDDKYLIQARPDLRKIIKAENDKNLRKNKVELPKYKYPDHVLTAAMCQYYASHDTDYRLQKGSAVLIPYLDSQKRIGKTIFGSGYLLSEKAAAEKAAAEKAAAEKAAEIVFELSEREKRIIEMLGGIK